MAVSCCYSATARAISHGHRCPPANGGAGAAGDFNGDGNLDLALMYGGTVLGTNGAFNGEVLLGDGAGGFTQGPLIPATLAMGTGAVAGDFNGDGKPDLLALNGGFLLGDGNGAFGVPPKGQWSGSVPANYLVAVDGFKTAGQGYIGVFSPQGGSWVYDRNGPASPYLNIPTDLHTGCYHIAAGLGDFNGDGKEDVLSIEGCGGLASHYNEYISPAFTDNWVRLDSQGRIDPEALVVADFNADGKLDWALTDKPSGTVEVELGDGAGGFSAAPGSPYTVGPQPFGLIAADFNGDGKPDLAAETGSSVTILLTGSATPGFQSIQFSQIPNQLLSSTPLTIVATTTSGLPVTFVSSTPGVCTVSGNVLTMVSAGFCTIVASQQGNSSYAPATPVSQTFDIQLTQSIDFAPIAGGASQVPIGPAPIALTATASSGLPVTFTSVTQSTCKLSANNSLTLVAPGLCEVWAVQYGNSIYQAAVAVSQRFDVVLSPPAIASVLNAASYASMPLVPDAYYVAFGTSFAAPSDDPSKVTVTVTDMDGHSASAHPFYAGFGQINFLMPEGLDPTAATVTVTNSGGTSAGFPARIGTIAPGLFTADQSGSGAPAGQVLIVGADNSVTYLPIAQCQASPLACSPAPISISTGEQVYLQLYGTGIRGGKTFSASIGGTSATVLYAGPQSQFPGLDQVNLTVPEGLTGSGEVDVVFSVDGIAANTVRVNFN